MDADITRVSPTQWHALDGDRVVGRGDASRRPDGRLFLSVDAWREPDFDRLAGAMLAALPRPLYTVVDEADAGLTAQWTRTGFATRRREWEYLVPTAPATQPPPAGVTILAAGEPERAPLRELDRAIRAEVEASVGWQEMPAEVLAAPDGSPLLDPARYAVAAESGRYAGLVRLGPLTRRPRIGLIAVRTDRRRRGIATALLAHALGALHARGFATATADVKETNTAAAALLERFGARRAASSLELVLAAGRG